MVMTDQLNEKGFQEKLDEIIQEKDIRFAGFIDLNGNLIKEKFREDIIPFVDDNEQKKIYSELAIRVSTRVKFDYSMGKVKYSASRREKVVMMSFALKNFILLITAEPTVNIDRLAYKIIKILGKEWREFFSKEPNNGF